MATQLNPWVFPPGKSFKAHLFTVRTGFREERYLTVAQPLMGPWPWSKHCLLMGLRLPQNTQEVDHPLPLSSINYHQFSLLG